MKFYFKSVGESLLRPSPEACFILRWDNWNDYSYKTYFNLFFYPEGPDKEHKFIGNIRIMRKGQDVGETTFNRELPYFESLGQLDGVYCSLGEDFKFYQDLKTYCGDQALEYLRAVNDISAYPHLRDNFQDDPCFKISLMRYAGEAREALDKGGQLFDLGGTETQKFQANITLHGASAPHVLNFDFEESTGIPHRINLLVGINGVGKTQIMANLAILLSHFVSVEQSQQIKNYTDSKVFAAGTLSPIPSIYNVITVSFSAFDSFEIPAEQNTGNFRYSYCGLRKHTGGFFTENEILENVIRLIKNMDASRIPTLTSAVSKLVKVADLENFISNPEEHRGLYSRLSAGQRITLNISCHLIDKISQNSLVLLDEPETHLHPKFMTTLFSVISEILTEFKSYAIIATHSPIVVQQVPSKYIQLIGRDRSTPIVTQPFIECFGENLSEISRTVFSTMESDRDYEDILMKLWQENEFNVDTVNNLFEHGLSMNARIYLNSLDVEDVL